MFRGLATVLMIVIVLAFVAAFSFSDTEIAAPYEARATLAQVEADIAQQQRINDMEFPFVVAEREKMSELAIAQLEQETIVSQEETITKQHEAENIRRIDDARTQAELNDIEHVLLTTQEERIQNQKASVAWSNALVHLKQFGFALLTLMVTIPMSIYLIRLAKSIPLPSQAIQSAQQVIRFDPLRDDLVYRQWQIEKARKQEQRERSGISVYYNGQATHPSPNPNVSA